MIADTKAVLWQAIDRLSPDSVDALKDYVDYLEYRERMRRADAIKELYDAFAPVRDAIEDAGMTEIEVDQIIDDLIDEVRHERSDD